MKSIPLVFALAIFAAAFVRAEDAPKPADPKPAHPIGYQNTPMQPNGKWHVHDGLRPQPKVVTPGTASTPELPGKAPSDAVVLFDGTNLDKWKAGNGKPSGWTLADGAMSVPKQGTENGGDIISKDEFGDCQLHVEWSEPTPPKGDSQGRGNSGVFMMGRYEMQVLDCYNNPTYADGATGSVYGQYPPLVNPVRPPGEWQTYDIIWTAPRFKDGKLESPAFVTTFVNGVIVQNHTELWGDTPHQKVGKYTPHGEKGPIKLQDHGAPVRFRNIWVRELKPHDAQ